MYVVCVLLACWYFVRVFIVCWYVVCCSCVFSVLLVWWCVVSVLLKCCLCVVGILVCSQRVVGISQIQKGCHNALWAFWRRKKAHNALWHSLNESKWPTTRSVLFFARKLPERVVGHLKCPERVLALFLCQNAFWAFFSLNEQIRSLLLTYVLVNLQLTLFTSTDIADSGKLKS